MELIEDIPFGLILCRAGREQVTVTGVSDRLLRLRLPEADTPASLELRFAELKTGRWTLLIPREFSEIRQTQTRYGFDTLLEIRDPAYGEAVVRALKALAGYIRLKEAGDDEALAYELTGCPYEHVTAETLAEQKARWFSARPDGYEALSYSLALSLDRPDAYERFLTMPFDAFRLDFFRRNRLDGHPLFGRRPERVYIGNPCCFRLFPEEPAALLDKCAREGLKATLVLPPVRESRRADLDALMPLLRDGSADEIAVNDWGTLQLLSETGKPVLLGIQLNRRRKDPRMKWKAGYASDPALLSENNLNDPEFRRYLAERNVTRFEYESCGMPVRPAPGKHSLHLPFFQTNTSHACPLAAACTGRDPGLPYDERSCAMPCLTHALLYPDSLHAVGRYNSIFGADPSVLSGAEYLKNRLDAGIDRVVAELL